MNSKLTTKIWGDVYGVSADWTQASDNVRSLGEDGWHATQWQVADFQHNDYEALRRILTDVAAMTGEVDDDEIQAALNRAETDD